MTASAALATLPLPPPVMGDLSRQPGVSSREMISWARASAQSGTMKRPRPAPPLPLPRKRRPMEMAMILAGQAGFLGAAIAGVAVMIA